MIKEIKYNGFTATPSDYECPDGELSAAINILPEEGEINPILPSSPLFTLPDGYKVVFIHTTSSYKHYIVQVGLALYWFDSSLITGTLPVEITVDNLTPFTENSSNQDNAIGNTLVFLSIDQVNAIGNTLVILSTDGIHYFLWKNSSYSYLGTHLPELPLSFSLQGERKESSNSEAFTVSFDEGIPETSHNPSSYNIPDGIKSSVTNQVLAKVNKFIAENYTNGNRFMYPFFVRYAYRLYDGSSLTMHSAPILMVCDTGQNPYVLGSDINKRQEGTIWKIQSIANCKVYAALYKLEFAVVAQKYLTDLNNWSDIVDSVDIFVSAPLYTFDQSGEVKYIDVLEGNQIGGKDAYCICKAMHGGEYAAKYQYHSMPAFMWYGKQSLPGYSLRLPTKGSERQMENIISASQFYLLKSYKLSNLSTTRRVIDVENGYFQSLVNREVMTDDFNSHSELIAKYSFVYNSRLNIAGISKAFPMGYHTASLLNFTDGFLQPLDGKMSNGVDRTYENTKQQVTLFVYIRNQGKEIVVRSIDFKDTLVGLMSETEVGMFTPTPFFYYPDKNAYKAVIYWSRWVSDDSLGGTGKVETYREIPLEPHPMLNGVFFFDWNTISGTEVSGSSVNKGSSSVSSRTINVPNKIYSSEVNNPFIFPASGITTVGTGTIYNIRSAVKALSQGQFGQFPLYAFTDEGVWALEVSKTGEFLPSKPVTRDVCTNPDSITQIDTAVLFTTDRGIMLISGSNSQCISDSINSQEAFDIDVLPRITTLADDCIDTVTDFVPFKTFLLNAKMLYDYTNQRIIVYNPYRRYAYVYSLKSKQWGLMQSSIKDSINSYPDALAMVTVPNGSQSGKNAVFNFSQTVTGDAPVNGLLITRPLKLDAPDLLKTIDTVIQRGYFRKGHVKTILYGSRDLFNWKLIYSSTDHYLRGFRGTPYKYFRIALLCSLTKDESIFGCTVQYTPRLLDQPR